MQTDLKSVIPISFLGKIRYLGKVRERLGCFYFQKAVKMQKWGRVCFQEGGPYMVGALCKEIKYINLLHANVPSFSQGTEMEYWREMRQ